MSRARILLADDYDGIRDCVRRHLERDFDIFEVTDGRAFIKAESELNPGVCILDISMPVLNGIDAAIQLKQRRVDH